MSLHSDLIDEILKRPATEKDHAAKAEIERLRDEIKQLWETIAEYAESLDE